MQITKSLLAAVLMLGPSALANPIAAPSNRNSTSRTVLCLRSVSRCLKSRMSRIGETTTTTTTIITTTTMIGTATTTLAMKMASLTVTSTKRKIVVGAGFGAAGVVRKNLVKIGRPGYRITKVRDQVTRQQGLLFQLQYPEIGQGVVPKVRFMSAFEQRVDDPPDKNFQYMLVAAEPYETCGFKLQAREIDRSGDRYWTWWDADLKEFWVQVMFLTEREERYVGVPGLPGR
ncbi:hypothetical protein NUW58_g5741 [Xylaria curta]|uniref:Uncharacterized protein n=1 Tax=Xylaria curta TaxID=42375 RepID=A0ACC1P0A9_9PEZI|nr:hypothetical protein NUW58_g5741 [Xylaria curta]